MKVKEILAAANSFIRPRVIAQTKSKYSGNLRVVNSFGDVYIATGVLTQTGGIVRDLWLPTVKKIKNSKFQKILILGLAGGTLAKLLGKYLPNAQITGVEIDPQMIAFGNKYLGLDDLLNLKIIIGDAQKNILPSDIIFVDLYLYDQIPDFVYSSKFLIKLRKSAKLVIINHLFYDEIKKQNAQKLISTLEKLGFNIKLTHSLTNLIISATPKIHPENSSRSRQNVS